MRIGFITDGFHEDLLAAQLSAVGVEAGYLPLTKGTFVRQLRKVQVVHGIFYDSSWRLLKLFGAARLLGTKTVRHWVGTDVLYARVSPATMGASRVIAKLTSLNLAYWENLRDELLEIGISSKVLPIVRDMKHISPLSSFRKPLTVLAYLPAKRSEFYGSSIIYALAKVFPKLSFLIIDPCRTRRTCEGNVEIVGYQDGIDSVYQSAAILVRITKHDGLPKMILEALAHGLHIVTNTRLPFTHYAHDFYEAAEALERIQQGGPALNGEGAEYVRKQFDTRNITVKLIGLYRQLLGGASD